MNPLRWSREHQIALLLLIAIGAALGVVIGFFAWSAGRDRGTFSYYLTYPSYNGVYYWGVFGAVIGGGIMYAIKLVRLQK